MKTGKVLYFDHQATTPVCKQVLRKMNPYYSELYGNPHSSEHILGWRSSQAVEQAAQQVGRLIGSDADEIIFTSGATESNNLALLGLVKNTVAKGSKRNKILVSSIEHKCVLAIGRVLQEQLGFQVETLSVDRKGFVSLSRLKESLGDDVLIVSIMAVNNEIGSIQDIQAIARMVRSFGAIFHCDAAQSPIALKMNDFAQDTDMLSLSGHKMYAPKGVGVLYIRRDLQNEIEPIVYGGGQQNGLRSGTLPTPLCVGMGAAAEFLMSEQSINLRNQLSSNRKLFLKKLSMLPWQITLNGPPLNSRHPGNVNVEFNGFIAQDILGVLQPYLAASTGSACTSGILENSHVLKAIGLSREQIEASIRFSLGFDTDEEDIDEAVELIDKALQLLSGNSSKVTTNSV